MLKVRSPARGTARRWWTLEEGKLAGSKLSHCHGVLESDFWDPGSVFPVFASWPPPGELLCHRPQSHQQLGAETSETMIQTKSLLFQFFTNSMLCREQAAGHWDTCRRPYSEIRRLPPLPFCFFLLFLHCTFCHTHSDLCTTQFSAFQVSLFNILLPFPGLSLKTSLGLLMTTPGSWDPGPPANSSLMLL